MDSREKISELDSLPRLRGSVAVVKGRFDVLTAELCALLADARRGHDSLLVLVYRDEAARPSPLEAFDRAQMVAALGAVDLVCVCPRVHADATASTAGDPQPVDADAAQTRDVVGQVIANLRD